MKLLINGQYFRSLGRDVEFDKATKSDSEISLYNGNILIGTFSGVLDMSVFELDGGEWSEPEPDVKEQLADALAALDAIYGGITDE